MTSAQQPGSILLSDFSGHAFTYSLADHLCRRGFDASYSYCSTVVAPKAAFSGSVRCRPVAAGRRFERYRLFGRAVSEIRYGLAAARVVRRERPEIHIVCNMPLLAALILWAAGVPTRCRFVVWLQDLQSGLAAASLRGALVPGVIRRFEGFVLRRAACVLTISPPLVAAATSLGVAPDRISLLRNWAPLEDLPMRHRPNPWSTAHGLDDRFVYLYSGTLARKHRPDLLVSLTRSLHNQPDAMVVVVSEGEGADELRRLQASDERLDQLLVLGYQPFDQMPNVLASADVLLVLLEPSASAHSVPSKTLSYLCAGRSILAAIPGDNDAARIIVEEAGAGIVVEPSDSDGFVRAAARLQTEPDLRARFGSAGRAYAEQNFGSERIVQGFLDALGPSAPSP